MSAGSAQELPAVERPWGVSFTGEDGEIFALLGPNGAGKMTTREILEGFRHRATAGWRCWTGERVTGRRLRDQMGLLLQDIAVEPSTTVHETTLATPAVPGTA